MGKHFSEFKRRKSTRATQQVDAKAGVNAEPGAFGSGRSFE
jgi:hypothetical protein